MFSRTSRIGIGMLLAVVLACAAPAWGKKAPPPRVCREGDLAGDFVLTQVTEKPPGEETAWRQEYRYHYLLFRSNRVYDYVASRDKFDSAQHLMDASRIQTVGETRTIQRRYTLDDTGLFNMYVDGILTHSYRCLILLGQADEGGDAGDLVLLGYSRNHALVRKVFKQKKW